MRMTIQQAIARIEDHVRVHHIGEPPHIHIGEALQMAIEALHEKAEREDPKPLTIEDLKQMIGEPVWVQGPGLPQFGRWAIVEDAFGNSLFLVNDFTCHDIGKTWLAYRHKPKEE